MKTPLRKSLNLCQAVQSIQCLWGKLKSVPIGDIDFGSINLIASVFNRGEPTKEDEFLLEDKEEPIANEVDDLLDLDWSSTQKNDNPAPVSKEVAKPAPAMDDDFLGVNLIEDTKPVANKPKVEVDDLDLFGDETIVTVAPNHNAVQDDLLIMDDDIPPTKPQDQGVIHHEAPKQPVANMNSLDNPYAFLDNIHTLETVKALHNNDFAIEDEEFVESDVTFAEPPKIHAFESSDLIIEYSSKQVN